ncbi:NAD(P)-binding domain-containing protein, partial [Bacillus cereus]|uniref:NAD(P)-binding domain-containing protein n=1 Tax=Bacillus cereus TaxID=1396 RepID=UPI00284B334C
VVALALNTSAVEEKKEYGTTGTSSLSKHVQSLQSQRILRLMLPHAVVDAVIYEVTPLLLKGNILIQAGNAHYKESIR